MNKIRLLIASWPHMDEVVVEMWHGDTRAGEAYREDGTIHVRWRGTTDVLQAPATRQRRVPRPIAARSISFRPLGSGRTSGRCRNRVSNLGDRTDFVSDRVDYLAQDRLVWLISAKDPPDSNVA